MVLNEMPDAPALGPDETYRIIGALNILQNSDPSLIPWDVDTAVHFAEAATAGSPATVAARAANAVASHLCMFLSRFEEARPVVALASRLAEESGEHIPLQTELLLAPQHGPARWQLDAISDLFPQFAQLY